MRKKALIAIMILISCLFFDVSFTVNEPTINLYFGDVLFLEDYVKQTGMDFSFSKYTVVQNLNASVVSVNSKFIVYPKNFGQSTLILVEGNKTLRLNVCVESGVDSVELDAKYISLLLGEIYDLKYNIHYKEDANFKQKISLNWTSSKKKIATISNNNEIVTHAPGTTMIQGTTIDGKVVATMEVVVLGHSKNLQIKNESKKKAVDVGETLKLKAYLGSKNVTESMEWLSLTPHILSVDNNGIVTALGDGDGKIQVKSSTGKKAEYSIHSYSMIDRVTLNYTRIKFDGVGQTRQLMFNLYPKNKNYPPILNGYRYTSSNEDVATVNERGLITARGSGIALISVVFEDSQKKASCTVEVSKNEMLIVDDYIPVKDIVLEEYLGYGLIGQKIPLNYSIVPENATNQEIKFDVVAGSDDQIKKINGQYYFIPNERGTIKIKIQASNAVSTSISIVVTSPINDMDLNLSNRRVIGTNEEELFIGEKARLLAKIDLRKGYTLKDVYPSTLVYDVENPEVAEIIVEDNDYYIRGLKKGKTKISLSTIEGMNETVLWVNVENPFLSISTDDKVVLPLGIVFQPRIKTTLLSTVKKIDKIPNIEDFLEIHVKNIYLNENFIDEEIAYEREKLLSTNKFNSKNERLELLKEYKKNVIDEFAQINVDILKDRNNRPYKFYNVSNNQVASNYPIRLSLELIESNTRFKMNTIVQWSEIQDKIQIENGDVVCGLDELISKYRLQKCFLGLSKNEQIKLLVTYMNCHELINLNPSYEFLSALEYVNREDRFRKYLKPMSNHMTKGDLVVFSEILHWKYKDRNTPINDESQVYFYDVIDENLKNAITLGYVEPKNNAYFGVMDEVTPIMLQDVILKIFPNKDIIKETKYQNITFERLVIILYKIMK